MLIWQPDRPAVDRPGRPPTVINMTVGQSRSTARPTAQIQRADFSVTVGRPVDRPDTESKLSGPVDRSVDRPTVPPDVHSSVHVGRPQGRPALGAVDRAVDRTMGRSTVEVDRRAQPCARLADTGPVDRTRELCSLYLGGRPDQRVLLSVSGRSTGRSTGMLQRSYL